MTLCAAIVPSLTHSFSLFLVQSVRRSVPCNISNFFRTKTPLLFAIAQKCAPHNIHSFVQHIFFLLSASFSSFRSASIFLFVFFFLLEIFTQCFLCAFSLLVRLVISSFHFIQPFSNAQNFVKQLEKTMSG